MTFFNASGTSPAAISQGKTFDDGRFSDARLAGQDRIVLPAAREDVDDLADFGIAPQHGIDFLAAGQIGEIRGELIERRSFGVGRNRSAVAAGCGAAAPLEPGRPVGAGLLGFFGRARGERCKSFSNCSAGIFANSAESSNGRGPTDSDRQAASPEHAPIEPSGCHISATPVTQDSRIRSVTSGDKRGRAGVAGFLGVERFGQLAIDARGVDVVVLQDPGQIGIGRLEQLEQPMLDFDIVIRPRQAQAPRPLPRRGDKADSVFRRAT